MAAFLLWWQSVPSVTLVLLSTLDISVMANNRYFTFQPCPQQIQEYTVEGASLISQTDKYYSLSNYSCSMDFQTQLPYQTFLLQFTKLYIRQGVPCPDHLSIYDSDSVPLLDKYCGALSGLDSPVIYTQSPRLRFEWSTNAAQSDAGVSPYEGFSVTLTAITQPPEPCDSASRIQCYSGDCISKSLKCDGVSHCSPTGEDELDCLGPLPPGPVGTAPKTVLLNATSFPPSTSLRPVTTAQPEQEIYLWLPLLVVVLFTGLMVFLIMIGRRQNQAGHDFNHVPEASNNNTESVETYTATDGRPATPPPTYSMIERQTSYVSYISQTSSQICEPPDYDEAVDMPGEQAAQRTPTRYVGRSISQQRPQNSFRSRIRDRLLNRSRSVQDPKHHRYKQRSGSSSTDADQSNISTDQEGGLSDISSTGEPGSHPVDLSGVSSPGSGPQTSTPERQDARDTERALLQDINRLVSPEPEEEGGLPRGLSDPQSRDLPDVALAAEPGDHSGIQRQHPAGSVDRQNVRTSEPHYVNIDMQNQ